MPWPMTAVHLHPTLRLGFQLAESCDVTGEDGVRAQRGAVSVVDATYLGFVFNAVQIALSPGSSHEPHEPAKISYVRLPSRNASARW